jgi:hypothetical protein
MADKFATFMDTPDQFGKVGAVITPSASDLTDIPKGVVLLTAGNVTVVPVANDNADALAFVGLPAGYIIPFRVRRVTAATATVATIE